MANRTTTDESNADEVTVAATGLTSKKDPPLSTLRSPSWDFLHNNYTKNELQKYCSQLQLGGIWTTKEKLVDKLMLHYSRQNGSTPSASVESVQSSSLFPSQEGESEDRDFAELFRKFENFVRETNDNFYVVNNTLVEREREIQELKTQVFLAEEKIKTLQEALQRRDANTGGLGSNLTSNERKTLLIGDSCLQAIKASDLKESVIIRTLPEANMSLIKSWITEKLEHPLSECIVYSGAQDILEEEKSPEAILDELGDIVTELKSKNENIVVKVCELVPSMKSVDYVNKINIYNNKLLNWCSENGTVYIRTEHYFKLGMGDVDSNCYENDNRPYDNLSRIGAVRLLDAIVCSSQDNLVVDNWKEVKQNPHRSDNVRRKSVILNDNNDRNYYDVSYRRKYVYQNRHFNSFSNDVNSVNNRNDHHSLNRPRYDNFNFNYYPSREGIVSNNDDNGNNRGVRRTGCFNCGEHNHRQSNCRYDHKLRCNYCHEYGHKSRLCKFVNHR